MTYASNTQSVSTTAVKLIDGDFEESDLELIVSLASGSVECRLSFASAQAASGVKLGELSSAGHPLRYKLPAGEDLWAKTDSGTATINLLVTKP